MKKSVLCCPLTSKWTDIFFRTVLHSFKQCVIYANFSPDSDKTACSLDKAILWIENSYFSQNQQFEIKNMLVDLSSNNKQLFASQDVNLWTGVVWMHCDVFISCLASHSDGTHSLPRIHWWVSDVMLHFSKSDEESNLSTSRMVCGWVNSQQIKHFGQTTLKNTILR